MRSAFDVDVWKSTISSSHSISHSVVSSVLSVIESQFV